MGESARGSRSTSWTTASAGPTRAPSRTCCSRSSRLRSSYFRGRYFRGRKGSLPNEGQSRASFGALPCRTTSAHHISGTIAARPLPSPPGLLWSRLAADRAEGSEDRGGGGHEARGTLLYV